MIEQRTEEWFLERCGKVTASRISDVVSKTKTGWAASRANYASQIIVERITGVPIETYCNAAMQFGIDTEPQAKAAYTFDTNLKIEEVGFVQHPILNMSGASPDGLIGSDGLVEIKCPNTSTHIETLLGSPIERKYLYQIQWQLACTGRDWCDFVSFDPRMPIELQIKIQKIKRDNIIIEDLEKEVKLFLEEIDKKVNKLKELMK